MYYICVVGIQLQHKVERLACSNSSITFANLVLNQRGSNAKPQVPLLSVFTCTCWYKVQDTARSGMRLHSDCKQLEKTVVYKCICIYMYRQMDKLAY